MTVRRPRAAIVARVSAPSSAAIPAHAIVSRAPRSRVKGAVATRLRRAALALAISAVPLLPGCASGPQRPELPSRPEAQRPDGLVPEGVTEMREHLADMRAENRDRMDAAIVRPTTLSESPTGPGFWDHVGNAIGKSVDFLTLRALGVW